MLYFLLAAYIVFAVFFIMFLVMYPMRSWLPILFLAINAAVNIPLVYLFWLYMPKRLRGATWFNSFSIMFMNFVICMFVPVLGTIALAIGVIFSQWYGFKKDLQPVGYADYPDFIQEKIDRPAVFSEGGAYARVKNTEMNLLQRVQALSAINLKTTPYSNVINQQTLQDEVDEVRLFAFSLLERQEKMVTKNIHNLLDKIKKHLSVDEQAKVEKKLAQLYWELYYMNLAQKELKKYLIKQAMKFASSASKRMPDDANLYVLIGRIHLAKYEPDKAKEMFDKALEHGASKVKVLPFEAEIAFEKKDFASVKKYLSESELLQDIPKLSSVCKFWRAKQ